MTLPSDPAHPGTQSADRSGARHEFRTVDSRHEYTGAILALRLDDVVMPGGRTARREVVEHFGAVAVVAVDEHGDLVLVEQYRHPLGRRLWELPAGLLDVADESPVDAAARELAEETALGAREWHTLVDLALSPGFTDEAIRVFVARDLAEVERDDPTDEEADMVVRRVPLVEAVAGCLDGTIVNATAVAGITAYAASVHTGTTLRPADAPWEDRPTAFARTRAARPGS